MKEKFETTLVFKVPTSFGRTIEQQARQQIMSVSEYARRALIEKLQRDGVCVVPQRVEAA
jgi:hypothetical protein